MIELFKINAIGTVSTWRISSDGPTIKIEWGVRGGATQVQYEAVTVNQSGRSLAEQVHLRIDSRVNRQVDKGYCRTIVEAKNSIGQNANKLPRPMLAQPLKNVNVDFNKCFVQRKYNGHRCLIASTEEGLVAYSRNGKAINTIDHILNTLNLSVGEILDGELYIHDKPLQNLGSLIRKVQPGNKELDFIVYDTLSTLTYEKRLDRLCAATFPNQVRVAPTKFGHHTDLMEELHGSIKDGFEGLILRTNDRGYEPGKRSSSLIKVKQPMDAEFRVVNIHESKDGWAVLECEVKSGKTFRVSAPGTILEKTEVLKNSFAYVHSYVNVEFFEWTNDGIPFHPVAIYFREEE